MIARRLCGIVTALLMLHLSFAGADVACAQHGNERAVQNQAADHHSHHEAASVVQQAASNEQPCEIPAQPECCHAMTSCAVSVAIEDGNAGAAKPRMHAVIASPALRTPPSSTAPPDPPPPKA